MEQVKRQRETFSAVQYLGLSLLVLAALAACLSLGSVSVPLAEVWSGLVKGISGAEKLSTGEGIVFHVRLPRVLAVMLVGSSLALSGVAMQGLLRNPLADGATLGVSAGASLGAVLIMAFGLSIPGAATFGRVGMAVLFAFLSLILILALAYKLDSRLSTNSIILIGVVFSLFASALMSLVLTFAAEKTRDIVFWTMGSLAGATLPQVVLLGVTLLAAGIWLFRLRMELNAFAIGESNAHAVGVDVKRVKMLVLILVSILIGVTVAIGGTIGFVGLVVPHMGRLLVGPNHQKLMPATLFFGAVFLLFADLIARTIASPLQVPLGVITSLVGAVAFVFLFWRQARGL